MILSKLFGRRDRGGYTLTFFPLVNWGPVTLDRVISGVDNRMEPVPNHLNWDGGDPVQEDDRSAISLRQSPTETPITPLGRDADDRGLEEIGGADANANDTQRNRVSDNPNEAVAPPRECGVPSASLPNFRRGGTAAVYPAPNANPFFQSPVRGKFPTCDQAFRWGSMNDAMDSAFTFLFSAVQSDPCCRDWPILLGRHTCPRGSGGEI